MSRYYNQGGYQNNSNYRSGGGHRGGGRHGGGRHGGGGGDAPWYETVKSDRSVQERPKWNLTSYGHRREEQNDICGDISPEEVRYANMISMQQGVQHHMLSDEFRKANRQRVDLFQGLTKNRQAPSIEGRPVMAPMNTIGNMVWLQSSSQPGAFGTVAQSSSGGRGFGTGFGSSSSGGTTTAGGGGFGSNNAAGGVFGSTSTTSGGGGFGTGFAGGFGTGSMSNTAPPSGNTTTGGFGTVFGSGTRNTPFGSQQQGGFGSFNQPQGPTSQLQSNSVFGQQSTTSMQPPFGGAPGITPFNSQQQQLQQQQELQMSTPTDITEEESRLWMTDSFEKGSIPTSPPPPHVCST